MTPLLKIPLGIMKQLPDCGDDHQRSYEPSFSHKHQVTHLVFQKAGNIYALTQVGSPYTHVHLPASHFGNFVICLISCQEVQISS